MKIKVKYLLLIICAIIFINNVQAMQQPTKRIVTREYLQNAIVNYSNRITKNPSDQDGYINRAYFNYLLHNYSEAIKDYNILINLEPNNEEFYLNRGYLYHLSHKREQALADYNMALRIKPNYAFAHNNRGVVLAELGRKEDSLKAYNRAIEIDPNYADAYYNRGNLKTNSEQNKEALEDFNTAISLNPSDSASYNNRGVVKRKLNYNVGALSDFSIAIRINPDDITALANRGRLKKRYFDSEGAEEDFKTAISVADESSTIVKEIDYQNQLAIQKKNIEKSKEMTTLQDSKISSGGIQQIAYQKPSSTTVKASVLKVDPKLNKTTELTIPQKENVPEIDTKPVINPELAECYYIRGLQKYILQNRESALKDFNSAIMHNPKYADAYYYRAAIKRDLNDKSFVDDYKTAIQIKPELKTLNDADVLMILKI